jgi:hypothetical protein
LKRKIQSEITNKVNCLSGCVQLIKVCKETCGNKILDLFNRLPDKDENILNHIRSYASEDRNHMSLMFNLYPYVKSIQSPNAIVYTTVPDNLKSLLRQRKRWCAGTICNDLLLIGNSRHNKWERMMSFTNVVIFNVNIFVFIATIEFMIAIVTNHNILMLELASIIIIPLLYSLSIPFLVYNDGKNITSKMQNVVYYYLGFINYYTMGFILNLCMYCYTLFYLDDLNWNVQAIDILSKDTLAINKVKVEYIDKYIDVYVDKTKDTIKDTGDTIKDTGDTIKDTGDTIKDTGDTIKDTEDDYIDIDINVTESKDKDNKEDNQKDNKEQINIDTDMLEYDDTFECNNCTIKK